MRILPALTIGLALFSPIFGKEAPTLSYQKLPISFEPNRGQAEPGALYVARGAGYLLTLDASGSRIILRQKDKSAHISSRLEGANKNAALEALDRLPGHSSYLRGQDASQWVTNLPNFARVRAAGVYPGIDLIYYGNQAQLEYDFVVSPGADPNAIRMSFDGVSSLAIDEEGNLLLATPAGSLVQRKPVVYQTVAGVRKPISGRFVVDGRTVRFELASYDRSQSLTIDPVLVYSSFIGNGNADMGSSVAVDQNGNLYVTGVTYNAQYGDADVLLRQIAPDGSAFLYIADIGGSDDDFGNGIAVDSTGSAYVAGYSASTDFPLSANAFQNGNAGINNAIIFRIDPTGTNLIYSTYIGGSEDDRGFGIALDSQGDAFLAGGTSSPDFPTSTGAYQVQLRGGVNCFIVEFDSQGNGIFSTYIGGTSTDYANGVAVDPQGDVYITGQTNSNNYPQVNNTFQKGQHGGYDAFITELSFDATHLIWSTFAGGGSDDIGYGIAVDSAGNTFVVGTTTSSDFPTDNAYQKTYQGGASDAFVMAYSANGTNLLFSTFLGSHGTDDGNGIALDSSDNIYIAGDTDSDQFPVTSGAVQPTRKGDMDGIFSILTPLGNQLTYSTFLGGSGDDSAAAVAVDQYGNAYLTGVTMSFDFPLTTGVAQTQPGGGTQDAFVAKIGFTNPNNTPPAASPVTTSARRPANALGPVSHGPVSHARMERRIVASNNTVAANGNRPTRRAKTSPYEPLFRRRTNQPFVQSTDR